MAMFWLQDEDGNILNLDDNIQKVTLGATKRNYSLVDFAGANGGYIKGFGSASSKKFVVSRREKIESGDKSFFNSRRDDILAFMNIPRWKKLYFYVRNGEDSATYRTEVFCNQIGSEKFEFLHITDAKEFELISPSGLFENIVETTDSQSIIGGVNTSVSITNTGTWECPAQLIYTPSSNASIIQFQIADEFGVRLEKLYFNSGSEVIYDTKDNSLSIGGQKVQTSQYLTDGGTFNFPIGSFVLKVFSDVSGTFEYIYTERKI